MKKHEGIVIGRLMINERQKEGKRFVVEGKKEMMYLL